MNTITTEHNDTEERRSDAAQSRITTAPEGASSAADSASIKLPPDVVPVLALRESVMFPAIVLPLSASRERSRAAAQYAVRTQSPIAVITQRDKTVENPKPSDIYEVGTVGTIVRYVTSGDGHNLITRGEQRFRIKEFVDGYQFLAARIERIAEPSAKGSEVEARLLQLRERALEALRLTDNNAPELVNAVQSLNEPGQLADLVASLVDFKIEEKQQVLETVDLVERLDRVLWLMAYRLGVLRLSRDIGVRTRETIEGRQREHILREQLRTIQKELGENDDSGAEADKLEAAIAKARMPEAVEKHARKELARLKGMPDAGGEASMLRTYLEWLTEVPWAEEPAKDIDIAQARKVLDEDHFGLEKIKARILEYLAVRKLNPSGKAPILVFVGPPGVGKTSLGKSIARATGRAFVRVSLGGVHDEAEIRGHRRTYIGALPGNIIQGIRRAGARDAVMMLDEIDKLGRGIQGDPGSALLEVLDPAQNSTFRDNYLGVDYDLSKVLFIATANMLDTIPGPLRDRMEVIQLSGYTLTEKLRIAQRYLVPRQLEENGLKAEQITVGEDALKTIISDYTREAGVRSLERNIGAVLRRYAVKIAEGATEHITVTAADIPAILGGSRYESEQAQRSGVPGVATGLAWTPVGGDILFIEAMRVPGNGRLQITGQLGDVMKESAQAAFSLVRSKAVELAVDPKLFETSDVHLHVPAGAVPKDGPSAGVAMFTTLASLATGRPVRSDVAMTGEISLRGLVLPVGGIKEKVLAAMFAGIKTVMLPARNRKDFEDIPEEARQSLQFVWLETVDQALATALEPRAEAKAA
jgi:ATP-dependent Lon protease